jgi:arginine decarboxylase
MNSNQTNAPFLKELESYVKAPRHGFHTPGHRGGISMGKEWLEAPLIKLDLTELSGLDWEGALGKARQLAAELYQADYSFFLVQGATQGILGAMLGCFHPGDTVLVARNCHLAVQNGLILAGLNPVYLAVDYLPEWGLPLGLNREALEEAVREYPDAKGLFVTNPTYQGITGSNAAYREIIGEQRLLVVDEAHGGHLEWSGLTGRGAFRTADLWVHGTHKILGSVTQTGMLFLNAARVSPEAVRRGLELVTTTSPSFILLAALDANRRFLAAGGRELFRERLPRVAELRAKLSRLGGWWLLTPKCLPAATDYALDPWKLTLSGRGLGLTGYQIEAAFQEQAQVQVEYADINQVTCLIAPWQLEADLLKLEEAVGALASGRRETSCGPRPEISGPAPDLPWVSRPALNPRAAYLAPAQETPLARAVGRIAAALVAPYPPGIPLLVPGEVIRAETVARLEAILAQGGVVRGIDSRRLIRCVEDR